MVEPTSQNSTTSVTGRRRRFTGAHPYPALPKSRLPLIRGVLWLTWAAIAALFDAAGGLFSGRRRARPSGDGQSREAATVARPPRMPSLTPTG